MVEIDRMVVEACQAHLSSIGTAWSDPRLKLLFEDGLDYVKEAEVEPFDVILVDGSDPVGPAVGLFNAAFYAGCARLLSSQGVFVTQSESPMLFRDVHISIYRLLEETFGRVFPYYYPILLYGSGPWSWMYASRAVDPMSLRVARVVRLEDVTRVYNRDIHRGIFAVPNALKRELGL